jgi:hypothetical protein
VIAQSGRRAARHARRPDRAELRDEPGRGGVLERYGVELIGASIEAIEKGENRESFKRVVEGLPAEWGAEVAASAICHTMEDCLGAVADLGYPVVVAPASPWAAPAPAWPTTRRTCAGSPGSVSR